MTELLTRATSRAADEEVAPDSVWFRGVLAAGWAVAVGLASLLVVVLVAWAADSRTGASAGQAVRAALQLWLVAHRVPLHVRAGTIALAPLLLTLGFAFLVARAAAVLARGQAVDDLAGVGRVAVAIALPYATLATFVAAAAHSSSVRPAPLAALGCGLVLALVAAGWGAARGAGLVRAAFDRLPELARSAALGGAAAFAVVLVGATLLLVLAVLANLAAATHTAGALGGGAVAGVALAALSLALVPNAAVCVVGYLSGPGFAVGAGTSVTLAGSHAGPLPAFPLLAAVPHGPAPLPAELAGIVTLVCAGIAAAWLVARGGRPMLASMARAGAAGAVAGVCTTVAAAFAGGPVGPGRMTVVGASPWQTGLAVAAEVAVVACGAAGALTWRRGR